MQIETIKRFAESCERAQAAITSMNEVAAALIAEEERDEATGTKPSAIPDVRATLLSVIDRVQRLEEQTPSLKRRSLKKGVAVQYRCRLGDQRDSQDARLRNNSFVPQPWCAAIIVAVIPQPTQVWQAQEQHRQPMLNLRVLADGPTTYDGWRSSVPYHEYAQPEDSAWRYIEDDVDA